MDFLKSTKGGPFGSAGGQISDGGGADAPKSAPVTIGVARVLLENLSPSEKSKLTFCSNFLASLENYPSKLEFLVSKQKTGCGKLSSLSG